MKLESLQDRPATIEDIGKTVYGLEGEARIFKINNSEAYPFCIYNETQKIKYPLPINIPKEELPNLYWQKPCIISESELSTLREENRALQHAIDNNVLVVGEKKLAQKIIKKRFDKIK